ncbi:MAG: hypothetical protein HC924_09570 [Synechococcaceae cyanobacterium SM2_3_2]|nr:hypothetical protein [Synechococcaceae cyanobacterium SM2_3_2]
MDMVANPADTIPMLPLIVVGVGFVAAISLGSLAWFNSKRPAGWENSDRPDFVPKIKGDQPDEESQAD